MEIILYRDFNKRRNSTKQPIGNGVTKEVRLKDTCSFTNPSFFLADAEQYVYLKAWNNYYFIDSIKYDINGASYIECSIDVLATFKEDIQNTSAFVSYSTSNFNKDIIDTRVAQRITHHDNIYNIKNSPFTTTEGCFILSCANTVDGQTIYALEKTSLDRLINELCAESLEVFTKLSMAFGDALGSIQGLRYIPIPRLSLDIKHISTPIWLGDWLATGETAGTVLNNEHYHNMETIDIPWKYSDFRRYNGFTNLYLVLPFVGKVNINPLEVIDESSLIIVLDVNIVTGSGNYVIKRQSDGVIIAQFGFSCGHEIPISTVSVNAEGFVNGAIEAGTGIIGAAATPDTVIKTRGKKAFEVENPVSISDINSVASGTVKATLAPFQHTATAIGAYGGGFAEFGINEYWCQTISLVSQTDPNELTTLYGRPYDKVARIGDLSGFVQTVGFAIDISSIYSIKEEINALMDTGVYLE